MQNLLLNIPEAYKKAFIIGYFDGDGCFIDSLVTKKKHRYSKKDGSFMRTDEYLGYNSCVSIKGTEEFLKGIVEYLDIPTYTLKKIQEQKIHTLLIVSNKGILNFYDCYKDCDFYLSRKKDKFTRKRRLEVTKQVQEQNTELLNWQKENQELMDNLKTALSEAESSRALAEESRLDAEKAKDVALNDLDVLQKRSQTELISTIVKVALAVIISVGFVTTAMYAIAMWTGKDTQIIGSTWSNMFGILLTNAFSIVGTIMGVKYASENNSNQ
jgi:hypothetical protein